MKCSNVDNSIGSKNELARETFTEILLDPDPFENS